MHDVMTEIEHLFELVAKDASLRSLAPTAYALLHEVRKVQQQGPVVSPGSKAAKSAAEAIPNASGFPSSPNAKMPSSYNGG